MLNHNPELNVDGSFYAKKHEHIFGNLFNLSGMVLR